MSEKDFDQLAEEFSRQPLSVPTDHPPKKQPVSKSQEFRFVLHNYWQQSAAGSIEFEDFYIREMDKVIQSYKAKMK